jgi:hypothetical protein
MKLGKNDPKPFGKELRFIPQKRDLEANNGLSSRRIVPSLWGGETVQGHGGLVDLGVREEVVD